MSYSFTVRAATKAEVKALVAEKLAAVVSGQPIHAKDQEQAQAAADSFVDLLPDTEERDYQVSVNGWLSWQQHAEAAPVTGAAVSVSVSLVERC